MSTLFRLKMVALGVAALLSFPDGLAADPADQVTNPIPVDDLEKGLMTALGDAFEFVGGELGLTRGEVGAWGADRFWFAKVRAKTAGDFAVSYTITLNFPANPNFPPLPEKAMYLIPIKIGERDAARVIQHSWQGDWSWPHANVGDTLIIPIHVDRFRIGHTFERRDSKDRDVDSYFLTGGRWVQHDKLMKMAAEKPAVVNDAKELDLLASWATSSVFVLKTRASHSNTGYLQFTQPGEFNLVGRLAMDKDDSGTSFRVAAKDKAVTVCLGHFTYAEHTEKEGATKSCEIASGTVEVRVGDRVVIECGQYVLPNPAKAEQLQSGVVVSRPFKAIPPYTPEANM